MIRQNADWWRIAAELFLKTGKSENKPKVNSRDERQIIGATNIPANEIKMGLKKS